MKLAVFDLEIVKTVTGVDDWFTVAPLGISCVAGWTDAQPLAKAIAALRELESFLRGEQR